MGLMPGDILISINGVPTTSTSNKLKIYKNIIASKENSIITVELLRNNMPLTITYKLANIDKQRFKNVFGGIKTEIEKVEENRIEANKIKIMHEKYQFAPTIEELRLREKQNMFKPKPKQHEKV
jgi:C-terminal processing protease CtpA/Prc